MEDAADLGLSAVEFGIDKFHDRVYDKATVLPDKFKTARRKHSKESETNPDINRRRSKSSRSEEIIEVDEFDPNLRRQQDQRQRYREDFARKPQRQNQRRANMSGYGSDGGHTRASGGRSTRGLDRDTYDPEQAGTRGYAGRDGYAAYTPTYAGGAYDAAERGQGSPRYLEDSRNGGGYSQYGDDPRRRSYENQSSRRGGYNDENDYSDEDEEEDERSRGGKEVAQRRRSQSQGGGSRPGSQRGEEKGKEELKKWGATLAGAAVGAYGGRIATSKHGQTKDNWVPTAIGAVVGGLIAREAEKEFEKHKSRKDQEKKEEKESAYGGRRSRSQSRNGDW